MLVNLSEIKQFYLVFQDSIQHINSQFNKPCICTNHKKKSNSLASDLLQQYLHYAPVQIIQGICKKNINPHVYWSSIFKGLQQKNKAYIYTHSNKVYSPEQLSQESSRRASDTRFILLRNHTGKLVVTASSHIRPQITDRHTCFTEMGNKQHHSLTCYTTATY